MTNLDRILKSRHITLPTKVHLVKAIVFLVVMYACESWTINKAEHQRINAFELWYWRLLRVSWTARRSNQSILKKINPQYSLEGLMLKLKLQYLGHTPSTFWLSLVLFQWLSLHIRLPKYWSFSFSISPSNEYSELIFFRMDWLDLLVFQGTLKSLLQHHS